MKKWMKIGLIVLCVVLVFEVLAWVFGIRVNPFTVQKIELYAYDHEQERRVVLNDQEALKAMLLFNISLPSREVDAQPCCDSYRLEMYFKNGEKLFVSEGTKDKLVISTSDYYVANQWLVDYILELVAKYELPID